MNPGRYVLNNNGQPVAEPDLMRWAIWTEAHFAETVVERTEVGKVEVSTVFLGLDRNFLGGGPPILWETMIFGGAHDLHCWRWHTRAEAEAGHARIVAALREGRDPEDGAE